MLTIKNIFKKILKIFVSITIIFIVISLALQLPAFPYNLNLTPLNLDGKSVLYIKYKDSDSYYQDSIHIKTYSNSAVEDKMIFKVNRREKILDGIILKDKVIFIVGELNKPDMFLYEYENDILREIKKISDEKISFETTSVNLIKIDNENLGILFYYQNMQDFSHELMVQIVNTNNPKKNTLLMVNNTYNVDEFYKPLSFINDNTYEITQIDDKQIIFKPSDTKISLDRKTFFDHCLIGYYHALCNGYWLYEINLVNESGNKKALTRRASFKIMDHGFSFLNHLKMSDRKDFILYTINTSNSMGDEEGSLYALSTSTGRKKLIEKNATPLYME